MDRRLFIRNSALAFCSFNLSSLFLSRALRALEVNASRQQVLVLIFQRGACDGLSLLPPIGDSNYHLLRPNIGISAQGEGAAFALDGYFGLNPGLGALKKYWDEGTLAFIPQIGSPDHSRSHFDAQDFMESGTPGNKNTQDGFLNRAMRVIPVSAEEKNSGLRAVALQATLPRSLHGKFPAISMDSIHDFGFQGMLARPQMVKGFEEMYQQATDQVMRGVGDEIFQTLKTVHDTDEKSGKDLAELYPKNPLGKHLREISSLIKAKVGLQIAATECGGWDTHVNQGNGSKGQLRDRFKELGDSLHAFATDLGPHFADVTVMCITEFGRTVKENGNRGTDHGHGSVMTLLGGTVAGKKVHSRWKDLSPGNLFEGRDAPVTTDYREILTQALVRRQGILSSEINGIFPGYSLPLIPLGPFRA